MSAVYFGLGTNLGNRLQNLRDALEKLRTLGKVESVSSVYETPAWGGVPQPDYLNACVKVEIDSCVEPLELLRTVKKFESELGRVPSVRWGARKIDIDILLIDDEVYHSEELNIPHMRISERMFVLVPLNEVLPSEWRHPENRKSVCEMINALDDESWPLRITGL